MKKIELKTLYPYLIVLLLFVVVAYAYFPALFEGKIVQQADTSNWRGAANEIIDYRDNKGEEVLWTNSIFSGMPATMIDVAYKGNYLDSVYKFLFWGPRPASYLILSFISFFLLMLAFGVRIGWAFIGALAYGFCAYNFQIIQVGHNTKMAALAFMPMVLAAVAYAFRKNRWLGSVFFGIALTFQIKANHPQITYYLAMIVVFYGIALLYTAIKEKTLPAFLKTACLLVVGAALAFGANANHLWSSWEYQKETMRGGSELTVDQSNQTKGGLDKEYATNWSYGVNETMNLLIPNFRGGVSTYFDQESETYKALSNSRDPNAGRIYPQLRVYWGPQAFTAGPMYMGAISIFLFILGLILIKGPMKWWIAGISLLALFLGWGRHFMFFSDFFYDYVPLYNKFRVPSMILIVLQLTIPLLGIYTLNAIFNKKFERPAVIKAIKIALGVAGGVCALFALIPGLAGSFLSPGEERLPAYLTQALVSDRQALLRMDAFRSLAFILLAAGVLWAGYLQKINLRYTVIGLALLVAADMWTIDKRYLNNGHFVSKREFENQFNMRPVDKAILQDKDPHYRVLDLTVDVFNDSRIAYYHKLVGGYSAAKLQRYQEMIEYFISPELQSFVGDLNADQSLTGAEKSLSGQKTLNMLNTKYIVIDPNESPIENRSALGNAWIVQDYEYVNNANEEIAGLKRIDPAETAVINKQFEPILGERGFNYDESATIELTHYAPNHMEYKSSATDDQLALFSEVYYPQGWEVTVDGKPAEHFRANYILRAMIVPAGEHSIVFEFKPKSYYTGATISAISSSLLILLLIGTLIGNAVCCSRRKKLNPLMNE